jgi:hypothetical protein
MLTAVVTDHVVAFLAVAFTLTVADVTSIESRPKHTIRAAYDKEVDRPGLALEPIEPGFAVNKVACRKVDRAILTGLNQGVTAWGPLTEQKPASSGNSHQDQDDKGNQQLFPGGLSRFELLSLGITF